MTSSAAAFVLQCGLYRRRLAEEFRSGRLDAEAQFRVQRIVARQGEDVGTLGVGDPLHDGALTDIERAGARVEKRARREHSRWATPLRFLSHRARLLHLAIESNGIPFVFLLYDGW